MDCCLNSVRKSHLHLKISTKVKIFMRSVYEGGQTLDCKNQ